MCGFLDPRLAVSLCIPICCAIWMGCIPTATAADRTTGYFPLPSHSPTPEVADPGEAIPAGEANASGLGGVADRTAPRGRRPYDGFDPTTAEDWRRYLQVWEAHHRNPADRAIRQFLGLPPEAAVIAIPRRGRSAPRELGWRLGTYRQIETPHFQLFTRGDEPSSQRIAEDLEKCFWIWTQTFFPLWEGSRQVSVALAGLSEATSVESFLMSKPARITTARKLKVVLFQNAAEYHAELGSQVPGIERSTGFYSDQMGITFLYAAEQDAAATRRHELVHQMFREATRSGLGRGRPGEQGDFWLVEGIAGYFESLWIGPRSATLGGWDSPRLQYARHRVVVGGDRLPWTELREDGLLAAQQRADLARWYAHAIAHTHRLLDDEQGRFRPWVFAALADLYRIPGGPALPTGLPETPPGLDPAGVNPPVAVDQRSGAEIALEKFLRIGDEDLISNRLDRSLRELCLAGCEVTGEGLAALTPQRQLDWLDLSRLPITDRDVIRLVPDPASLSQLSLEATKITPGLETWLGRVRRLRELDLSWTAADDRLLAALPDDSVLETLWLTGSQVGDEFLNKVGSLKELRAIDLQRTAVGDEALRRLRSRRPSLEINPLQLRIE